MQRLFGILMLLGACVAASELGLFATRLAADDNAEGVRAIIVHGELVKAPIVITDFEMATALHEEVIRALKHGTPVSQQTLNGRPCLRMALFLSSSRTARIGLAELKPEQADARWAFYPAVEDRPAVLERARVSKAQLDALASYGVPVAVAAGAKGGCVGPGTSCCL